MGGLSEFLSSLTLIAYAMVLAALHPACLNGVPSLTVVNFACYCCVCFQSVDSVQ